MDEKPKRITKSSSCHIPKPQHDVVLWDCGSSLYDSFELKSFQKQLDSAIANSSRTLSMSRLPDRSLPPPPPKPKSKIARSLQRLVRSLFGTSTKRDNSTDRNATSTSPKSAFVQEKSSSKEGFYYIFYDKSGALSAIPEVAEFDGMSPEIRSLVRRTASERFTAATSSTSVGIYC